MIENILLTGPTGNVGKAVLQALSRDPAGIKVTAALRDPDRLPDELKDQVRRAVSFDFRAPDTFAPALEGMDGLFLVRPPQISQAKKYFEPLIAAAREAGVKHVVFLSVQGAEQNSFIPHHQIERIILESGLDHTFLRPAYFMQNFLTTLHRDLVEKDRIFLPAGDAKFTLIDVRDVGRTGAEVLRHPAVHRNRAYDLTNEELLNFGEMAGQLSEALGRRIDYQSPNLLRFFLTKKKEGLPVPMILVMIMLHYLPRLSGPPGRSREVERITGRAPFTFQQFIADHRNELED